MRGYADYLRGRSWLAGAGSFMSVAGADLMCLEISDRIAARVDLNSISQVEIRSDTLDAVGWYQGDKEPEHRTVHATCSVDRDR